MRKVIHVLSMSALLCLCLAAQPAHAFSGKKLLRWTVYYPAKVLLMVPRVGGAAVAVAGVATTVTGVMVSLSGLYVDYKLNNATADYPAAPPKARIADPEPPNPIIEIEDDEPASTL